MPLNTGLIMLDSRTYSWASMVLLRVFLMPQNHTLQHGCGYTILTSHIVELCSRHIQQHRRLFHYTMRHYVVSVILWSTSSSPVRKTSMPGADFTGRRCMPRSSREIWTLRHCSLRMVQTRMP